MLFLPVLPSDDSTRTYTHHPWFPHQMTLYADQRLVHSPALAFVCSPSLDPAISREHEHFIFRTLRDP